MPKKLENMTEEEWEAVCNRCGKCCLIKLQDEDSGEIYYTDVVCKYFDFDTCECTQYQNRCTLVPECLKLTKDNVGKIGWMPKSCAYRCLIEGRPRRCGNRYRHSAFPKIWSAMTNWRTIFWNGMTYEQRRLYNRRLF